MFGKLTLEALPHDSIVIAATIFILLVASTLIFVITRFKRWTWLWNEWITSVDHKKIGIMYLILAFVMLLRGFTDVLLMRTQQAIAVGDAQGFLPPDHYDQIFTAHGVIMIFFVAMPFMFGLINLAVPMQIGARDVAFPFLNSLSFWLTAVSAMIVNTSLVIGQFAAAGWLAYPPLSELAYSPGVGIDYYIWALQISGIGTLIGAINFFVTIVMMRCKGMTLMRMPVFTWTSLCSMGLIIVAFPVLTATLLMLSLDRLLGMHFFTSDFGGNPMMYVNLIWAWGHPEVYILILPAFGIFSEVAATFSKKKLFGYTSMIYATIAITGLSFLVWLHHFFTMGSGANVNAFFGIMTMIIAIPTGVKIFNWLFTMFRGRITFDSPMLWMIGFIATFTFGGMTGVLLSLPGVDFQLHNSLFLVAHFHNTIIGGVLFGYFAGLTYWFPKFFGFKLSEKWGKLAFWHWIIGFFVAFTPLYVLGLLGMTRRLNHVDAHSGWHVLLVIALCGAIIIGMGVLMQVVQLIVSIKDRKKNRDETGDPWDARTLEWSTVSPPPAYNFAILPSVSGRYPFWDMKESNEKKSTVYEDILMPKNTGLGFIIAVAAYFFSISVVWHIWWLTILSTLCILFLILLRTFESDTEFVLSKEEVAKLEEVKK